MEVQTAWAGQFFPLSPLQQRSESRGHFLVNSCRWISLPWICPVPFCTCLCLHQIPSAPVWASVLSPDGEFSGAASRSSSTGPQSFISLSCHNGISLEGKNPRFLEKEEEEQETWTGETMIWFNNQQLFPIWHPKILGVDENHSMQVIKWSPLPLKSM